MGDYSSVDNVGIGGGLCLFWKNMVSVQIPSYSLGHIDVAIIHLVKGHFCVAFIGI